MFKRRKQQGQRERERDRDRDRQTDRQTDRQRQRERDRQTDRQTETQREPWAGKGAKNVPPLKQPDARIEQSSSRSVKRMVATTIVEN